MLFNSTEFIPFLLLVLVVHWVLIPARFGAARKAFLVASSYGFYMSWNPKFGALLLISTLVDFNIGLALSRVSSQRARRMLLVVSLLTNLGMLATFKYGLFFASGFTPYLPADLARSLVAALDVALPIGISFYTFQTLSYTIDVYRGSQRPTRSLLDFALYVSFFPQLVAGPIVRSGIFLPQLQSNRSVRASDFEAGAMRVAGGLVKKVVFADTLATLVEPVFASPELFGGAIRLLAVYAYAYQIYFDFSGYSDIAIGLGRMFGIRLPENFDRPYLAASPREFWRRWHITLSTWLRDYLFIPLGGSRAGDWMIARNLLITMALGGLWHGAAGTFVAWGVYHGALLVGQRIAFGTREPGQGVVPRWVRQIVTFHLVCLGWLLFRSESLERALAYLGVSDRGAKPISGEFAFAGALLLLALGLQLGPSPERWRTAWLGLHPALQGFGYAIAAIGIFFFSTDGQRFIYFQF